MCVAIDYTQKIISVLHEATEEKERLFNLVHQCDLKTCDLLHTIELNEIGGMYNAYLIVKELKEVRELRRKAKDEIYLLDRMETFRKSQQKKCENLMSQINLTLESMKRRKYNIRVNEKLTNINI